MWYTRLRDLGQQSTVAVNVCTSCERSFFLFSNCSILKDFPRGPVLFPLLETSSQRNQSRAEKVWIVTKCSDCVRLEEEEGEQPRCALFYYWSFPASCALDARRNFPPSR